MAHHSRLKRRFMVIQIWIAQLARIDYKSIYLYYCLIDNFLFMHENFMAFLNKDILSLLHSLDSLQQYNYQYLPNIHLGSL